MAWDALTPEGLAAPHRPRITVEIERPDGTLVPLPVLADGSLTVSLDETRAPYAAAAVTVPASAELLELADPLRFTPLVITTGYTWADGTTTAGRLARLPLISRVVQRPANTVALRAAGVETLAQNYHFQWHNGPLPAAADTLAAAYDWLIQFPTSGSDLTIGRALPPEWSQYGTLSGEFRENFRMEVGDNLWSVMEAVGTEAGAKLYGNELGYWSGRPLGNQDSPTVAMELRAGLNLITAEAALGLGEFYNAVTDVYRHETALGNEMTTYGRASLSSGPYSTKVAPWRVKVTEHEGRYVSQGAATAAAIRRLRNLSARRDVITAEAVADYRIRPKHRVALRLPSWAVTQHWIVQAVTFTPGTGRMKLTLRRPIDDGAQVTTSGE